MNFVYGRVENIVRKGEKASYQNFLFFSQCFQKAPPHVAVKSRDCVAKSQCRLWIFKYNNGCMDFSVINQALEGLYIYIHDIFIDPWPCLQFSTLPKTRPFDTVSP